MAKGRSAVLLLCDWLIPPHVVGDALADVGAVVEIRRAHRPGISASQPVAAREEEGRWEGEPDKARSRREARWKWQVKREGRRERKDEGKK